MVAPDVECDDGKGTVSKNTLELSIDVLHLHQIQF